MNDNEVMALCNTIRHISLQLHEYLRHGHLEKVYLNGLVNRLSKAGLSVQSQVSLKVKDEDGTILGDFKADLIVNDAIILEIKACQNLIDEHTAQLLGYMRATGIEHGLLINFGAPKLQIRKFKHSWPTD